MTLHLDYDTALSVLTEVVAERPSFVYDPPDRGRCVYVSGGEPSCGVGHALVRLGIPVADLAQLDSRDVSAGDLDTTGLVAFSDEATRLLLARFQEHQDSGVPWQEALRRAT